MKKVLIISFDYPPIGNVAARRFGDLTNYMNENGWEPYVLTTNSSGTLPVRISESNIIRIGSHPQSSIKLEEASRSVKNPLIRKTQNIYHRLGFNFRIIDKYMFTWMKEVKSKKQDILNEIGEVDLVLSSFGPGSSIWLGRYFSKALDVPWVLDYRDLGSLHTNKRNKLVINFEKVVEKLLISPAVVLTTIGDTLKDVLNKNFNKESFTIFNGWDKSTLEVKEDESANRMDNSLKSGKYIYYAGRFYEYQLTSMFLVLDALKTQEDIELCIRSLGPEEFDLQIKEYAEKIGVTHKVKFLPPTDQYTVSAESNSSLINLVIEDLDQTVEWKKGTLTGKFLGLLPLTPPILTVARSDSEIGDILNHTKKGLLCSNFNEVESFLDSVIDNKEKYSGDFKSIEYYSKETQAKKLCEVLNNVLS